MPARVHALLIVRPEGRVAADIRLRRTLTAVANQTRPVDAITIVLCGDDRASAEVAATSGAEAVITAGRSTTFAEGLRMASHRLDGNAVWLLGHDCAPEPDALAALAAALETAPSVAVAAPKLVRWEDRAHIVSLGVSMTRFGRTVGLADDEHDQGQHDAREDVLGADVRGLLVRAEMWRLLDGVDPALRGADEGLDLSVRARLSGSRVALTPAAVVAVGAAEERDDDAGAAGRRRSAYHSRLAQVHRRLVYAAGPLLLLHWLTFGPLAVLRSAAHLLAKRPGRIAPELGATIVAALRIPSIVRARAGIRRVQRVSWSQLAPLRIGGRQLRHRLDDEGGAGQARSELGFFRGDGGVWIVVVALAVSLAAFPALLAWPALGGGALAPLRTTVAALWADALAGPRPLGWDTVGPADPFSAVVAALGSLSPWEPSRALVALWILALPLAALGGWFAATRLTEKPLPRALVAIGWALAPTFLAALLHGRPTAVLVHLLLPWLFTTGAVAHRSWTAAASASLILAAVVACAPSLAPAILVLWLLVLVLVLSRRGGRGAARVVWLVIPSAVAAAPLVWHRLRAGEGWALFADPGVPAPFATPRDDVWGRLGIAAGFPTDDVAGWAGIVGEAAGWMALLIVPILLLALAAPAMSRMAPVAVCYVSVGLGVVTALVASGVQLSAAGATPVTVWPGAGLSLAWAGLLGAAALALAALPARTWRGVAAAVPLVALVVLAVPAMTAFPRDQAQIDNGPDSTLPAYVSAEGRGGPGTATLVLTPQREGGVVSTVVWGGSVTLGGQTTLQSSRQHATTADETTASVTADLITGSAGDVVSRLADHGIAYILLDAPGGNAGQSDDARVTRLAAQAALDRRDGLEAVGETGKGQLWFVRDEVTPRAPSASERATAWSVAAAQLGIVVVTLLLAVPTAASIRQSRRRPRVVGGER
ncbi:glycosyltransferase [Microbacterium sp. TNHR37B]|uniref:glycosyltransferase n=1 Tax=Microbacterium sp. TNHR37B TaxID=1775956 RepID=UPI0007B29D97|nr:glycosyltransferase [Microbacterium sp. TNHR37B]KZE89020.1 hypothetical protein AVP41_01811 [Microbacterium sp. TNHR37B]